MNFSRTVFIVDAWRPDIDNGTLYRCDLEAREEYPTYSDALAAVHTITRGVGAFIVDVCQVWHEQDTEDVWEGWNEVDGTILTSFIVAGGVVEPYKD